MKLGNNSVKHTGRKPTVSWEKKKFFFWVFMRRRETRDAVPTSTPLFLYKLFSYLVFPCYVSSFLEKKEKLTKKKRPFCVWLQRTTEGVPRMVGRDPDGGHDWGRVPRRFTELATPASDNYAVHETNDVNS